MVELQIVILAVAGSSPVGHPTPVLADNFLGNSLPMACPLLMEIA